MNNLFLIIAGFLVSVRKAMNPVKSVNDTTGSKVVKDWNIEIVADKNTYQQLNTLTEKANGIRKAEQPDFEGSLSAGVLTDKTPQTIVQKVPYSTVRAIAATCGLSVQQLMTVAAASKGIDPIKYIGKAVIRQKGDQFTRGTGTINHTHMSMEGEELTLPTVLANQVIAASLASSFAEEVNEIEEQHFQSGSAGKNLDYNALIDEASGATGAEPATGTEPELSSFQIQLESVKEGEVPEKLIRTNKDPRTGRRFENPAYEAYATEYDAYATEHTIG